MIAIPAVVYFAYNPRSQNDLFIAAWIFGIALWTDFFDGWLARKLQKITVLGRIMDPMADKLMIVTGLVMVLHHQFTNVFVVITLLSRELAVTSLRSFASANGIVLNSSQPARAKVFAEGIGVGFLLMGPNHYLWGVDWFWWGKWILYLGVVLAVTTAVHYFFEVYRALR